MILKLKPPGAAGDEAEESGHQALSDILTNDRLFGNLLGKSLVLQAEMTVEKRKEDGSPKTMTMSGLVPVTLSKGFRNGKPTRELRVRGHLRKRRTNDMRLPYDDLALKNLVLGSAARRETHLDRRPTSPENSKLLQAGNSKVWERYRTLSTVSTKSKRESLWPQADGDIMESADEGSPEPSRIENWSPLFDYSSPMSGPTGRDRVRALSDWTTPTPRFDLELYKDEGSAEERSKGALIENEKEKRIRYTEPFQKEEFEIVDRTLVIGKTDSSDIDEYDKCSAKPCCKDKLHETRDTGIQTSDWTAEKVARVHSSSQTDAMAHKESSPDIVHRTSPKRTNLISPEEIQGKLSKGYHESKQIIATVHEKAANKFAEVHEKIQNAIRNSGENKANMHSPARSDRPLYNHTVGQFEAHPRTKNQYTHAPTSSIHSNGNLYMHGHESGLGSSHTKPRHEADYKGNNESGFESDHSVRNSQGQTHDLINGKTHANSQLNEGNIAFPNGRLPDKYHLGEKRNAHLEQENVIRRLANQGQNTGKELTERHESSLRNHAKNQVENYCYSTERGHFYESPQKDPSSRNEKNSRSPEAINGPGYHNKHPERTRPGSAHPGAIEKVRELFHQKSGKDQGHHEQTKNMAFDGNRSNENSPKRTISPAEATGHSKYGENPTSSHSPSPSQKAGDVGRSHEKMGAMTIGTQGKTLDAKAMNPVATITVSRSHTRLFRYTDGYTYTEKAGRQMVVIEAPKGLYYAP